VVVEVFGYVLVFHERMFVQKLINIDLDQQHVDTAPDFGDSFVEGFRQTIFEQSQ
jgi:hypothetical protein